MAIQLSKSKYCQGVQCPKILWLRKNKPEEFDDSVMDPAALATGNEVGNIAKGLFGDFKEIPFDSTDFGSMIRRTEELIQQRTPIITEATFSYKGLLCRVDILKNAGNKAVELYEVKSSTDMKDIYYEDAGFQRYVLTMAGYDVRRVCLVYLNNQYVRHGELDLAELFHIEDITEKAVAAHDAVAANIKSLEKYMKQKDEPSDDIGEQCFKPYSCGFWNYCTRLFPQPNVFGVAGMQSKSKCKHYREGIISFQDLRCRGKLNHNQTLQVEAELTGHNHIDERAIRDFLSTLSYPLYFLDFETFAPAIPPYDGLRPYEKIPFQYSLHYIEEPNGTLEHKEFLAKPGEDPRRDLAEQLCKDIPLDVCTTAYNMGFEKSVISGLAKLFPDLGAHLMNIHVHILNFPQTMISVEDEHQKGIMELVTNLLIEVFSFMAEEERKNIRARQAEGIAVWRKTGKTKTGRPYGRPRAEFPSNWEKIYGIWKAKSIKSKDAWKLLNISKNTFYKFVKEHEQNITDPSVTEK